MDLISILPFVVPPIVLVVGLLPFLEKITWLFVRPEVLSLIYVIFALPFLYRALDAAYAPSTCEPWWRLLRASRKDAPDPAAGHSSRISGPR